MSSEDTEPTGEDRAKAIGWQYAIDTNKPHWLLLAPHQQEMILARIKWALGEGPPA